jgi:putative transposase
VVIRKAYVYRLRFKRPDEASRLHQYAGCCRFVWNKALALQKERLDAGKRCLSYPELAKKLLAWKEEHPFLKEVPSQSLQQRLMDLDKALRDAFDKKSPKRFPVFKKKYRSRESFRYPQGFRIEGKRVFLPKFGWARFFKSREISGRPKNVTVFLRGDHWFISVQTEQDACVPVHPSRTAVGCDFGAVRLVTLSDGSYHMPVNAYKERQDDLAHAQAKLARMTKRSRNFGKQKRLIRNIHIQIADKRIDHLQKISHDLSKNHALVALEDLSVANMTRSAKGTKDAPGRHVKQKAGLNRVILDQGWGTLRRLVEYKTVWRGGMTVFVDPAHTSQECSSCGHVSPENRPSQELFYCKRCGHTSNADENAAKVVLSRVGHTRVACELNGAVMPSEAGTNRAAPSGAAAGIPDL